MMRDVACHSAVTALRLGAYYMEEMLKATCTAGCSQALAKYQAAVDSACPGHTFNREASPSTPILMIPNLLCYFYNLTYLTDSGRYCNIIAAEATIEVDYGVPLGRIKCFYLPPPRAIIVVAMFALLP
jgi:hypothetical protein